MLEGQRFLKTNNLILLAISQITFMGDYSFKLDHSKTRNEKFLEEYRKHSKDREDFVLPT